MRTISIITSAKTALVFLIYLASTTADARHHGRGRLPWCGIYLGQYLGKHERRLWVAREWAREGSNAGGPGIGTIVVWPHHVGIIEGRSSNGMWIIRSGNDGNAVRVRPRSVAGAIAFRRL